MIKVRQHWAQGAMLMAMLPAVWISFVMLPLFIILGTAQLIREGEVLTRLPFAIFFGGILTAIAAVSWWIVRKARSADFVLVSHNGIRLGQTRIPAKDITSASFECASMSYIQVEYSTARGRQSFAIAAPRCFYGFLSGERVADIIRKSANRAKKRMPKP